MSVVPATRIGKVEFYENHNAGWLTNATALGTTSGAVTALTTLTTAARDAYNEQQVAQAAARAKTLAFNNAVDAMARAGSDIIKQVRAKAATAGDGVYVLAQIPAPALPSPVGTPGTPYRFQAALKPNGSVELKWKCDNPAGCTGVIYQVFRKVESTGEYVYVGGVGTREFVDATVPAGVPTVMYQIQGTRTTAVGDAAEFVVNFGVSGGAMTATAGTGTPAKIAA